MTYYIAPKYQKANMQYQNHRSFNLRKSFNLFGRGSKSICDKISLPCLTVPRVLRMRSLHVTINGRARRLYSSSSCMKLICASKVEFKWSQSSPATSQPAVTRYSAASNSPSQTNQQRGEFRSGGVIPIEAASPGLEKKEK